jgi:(heptosyl)LPS beta-1,4-glucosyltransferase
MTKLSAVLIVKNEGDSLAACLEKLRWADEIIVLDSGSTDNTREVARKFTSHVYVDEDWQGFGIQRQRAQARARGDWILMVDADEHVTDKLRQEIQHVISANAQNKVYEVPRLSWCFGGFIRHSGWYPDYVVRLYPRQVAHYGPERVHEKLQYAQTVEVTRLKGDLLHYTYRDLEHYLVKSAQYAKEWAMQRAAQGRSTNLLKGMLHGIGCFVKMYVLHAGFLDGRQGFLLAVLSAHSTFVKYADLWIRTKTSAR